MKLFAYDQFSVFEQLESEWNDLVQRSTSNRVFSTWEWQSIWWEAYHPGQLWVIVCREENGQLIGVAPWFIEQHPEYGRVVRSIGCVEVTDYLDLIIDAHYTEAVFNHLSQFVAENQSQFDVIDLCNLPEISPTYTQFPAFLTNTGFDVHLKEQEVCPVIDLPGDWEAYLESLDKKQRHELRRKLRRIEGATEQVKWYIVDESHNLHEETEHFLRLMAASHVQKSQFLDDPQNVVFFKNIVPAIYNKGWLQMVFLTIDDQHAAAYLNFVYENVVQVYNSGLKTDEYGHLSPGIILLAYCIRWAIEHKFVKFDFLRGNEVYKYRMGGKDTRVFMLRAESTQE